MKETNQENFSEVGDLDATNEKKKRHGCATAWLILLFILCIVNILSFTLAADYMAEQQIKQNSAWKVSWGYMLSLLNLCFLFFLLLLWQWKKLGFYGILVLTGVGLVMNIYMRAGLLSMIVSILFTVIIWGTFQMKENNKKAWDQLE